jgi:DNA-binding NtrC family response regulator
MEKPEFEYSIKVLIIGEDKTTDELLSDTLTAIGYQILIVDTMDQAKEILAGRGADLVIGDPRHSGGSWKELLDTTKQRTELPVIFITDADDPEKNNYLKAGADGILSKPFRIGKIEQLIANTLLEFDKSSAGSGKKLKKILVADDDEAILSILNNALSILGYDTVLARSGDEALEKFKKGKFDILISDFMMPGLTGKELISAVKEIKPDFPAIMITGYPLAFPPGIAKLEGIDAYLVKPFRINQLQDLISRLLPDDN